MILKARIKILLSFTMARLKISDSDIHESYYVLAISFGLANIRV